jgi:hypothetical protein
MIVAGGVAEQRERDGGGMRGDKQSVIHPILKLNFNSICLLPRIVAHIARQIQEKGYI